MSLLLKRFSRLFLASLTALPLLANANANENDNANGNDKKT